MVNNYMLTSFSKQNRRKTNNFTSSSSNNLLSSSTAAGFTTRRRKAKPHHRDKDYNLRLSSIMKPPKYSPSSSITEAELRNLLEVSDLTFRLSSSLPPSFGIKSLDELSESQAVKSNSLTSASSSDVVDYQYWLPKGVDFCETVELYLYK